MTSFRNATEVRLQREVTAAIAAGSELKAVLARITRGAMRLCRAEMAAIALLAENREELELVSVCGVRAPVVGTRLPVADSLGGDVIRSEHSVRRTDASRDRRSVVREMAHMTRARAVLIVPLRNREGPFGTLGVAKRTGWHFTARDEALLTQLADSASIAIQSGQLRERLRGEASSLRAYTPANPSALSAEHPADGNGSRRDLARDAPPRLSLRQRDILRLLVEGKTCKEMASALGISARTVEHYVERLKLRFDQPRLHALVAYAITRGLSSSLGSALIWGVVTIGAEQLEGFA